jgi:hypothetical protein
MLLSLNIANASKPHPFRFQNMWLKDPTFKNVVSQVWEQPSCNPTYNPTDNLYFKLYSLKRALQSWNRWHFGAIHSIVKDLENRHDDLEAKLTSRWDDQASSKLTDTRIQLEDALAKYYDFLAQKVKIGWLLLGEGNNVFFFATIKKRFAKRN